jgi:hypothetical protein
VEMMVFVMMLMIVLENLMNVVCVMVRVLLMVHVIALAM